MLTEFKTSDPDELAEKQKQWSLDYRLLGKGYFQGHMAVRSLEHVQADVEFWAQSVEISGSSPADGLSIVFSLDHGGGYVSRGSKVERNSVDCYGGGTDIHAITRCAIRLGSICVNQKSQDQLGSTLTAEFFHDLVSKHTVVKVDQSAMNALRQWHRVLVQSPIVIDERHPGRSADRWITSQTIEKLIEALWSGKYPEVRKRQRYYVARAARDIILSQLAKAPTILEICAEVRVSPRTLQYAFQEVFGTSAKCYLNQCRLMAVRRILQSSPPSTSISRTMADFGFFDPGHFAKDYRALFGELPSETLSRNQLGH